MGRIKESAVPICIMLAIASMILPLGPAILDTLLVCNLVLAFILLLNAVYIRDPLQMSSLPTLLLLSTLFRLGLNISTTRLILSGGDAGKIVDAFGHVVTAGNLVVGIVVFLVVTLIQFIVIAKGAERVAEVAARFTLDGLPGRQMSIDADVRAGLMDFEQARQKRIDLQTESRFYGALDGAMKFIKGDAIAGIAIVVVNLIGGLVVGIAMHGMPVGDAIQRYSLLTIGDGLVSQIPALLNALAAGLVVTRVARGDGASLAHDLLTQLGEGRAARTLIGALALGVAFVPNMPTVPFLVVAVVMLGSLVGVSAKRSLVEGEAVRVPLRLPALIAIDFEATLSGQELDKIQFDLRSQLYERCGALLPRIECRGGLARSCVYLREHIVSEFNGRLDHEAVVAVLTETLLRHVVELIDDQHTRRLLQFHEEHHAEAVSSLVPAVVSVSQLTEVLRLLAEEQVSFRSFDLILQGVSVAASKQLQGRALLQEVRVLLGRVIVGKYMEGHNEIKVIALDPAVDLAMVRCERGHETQDSACVSALAHQVRGCEPPWVIACSRGARRLVFESLRVHRLSCHVLAYEEIPDDVSITIRKMMRGVDQEAMNSEGESYDKAA